jgi:hypothetical protein
MRRFLFSLTIGTLAGAIGCSGADGPTGPAGADGQNGTAGTPGQVGPQGPQGDAGANGTPAVDKGTIAGTVKDAGGLAIAGVAITTTPASGTANTDASGNFTLSSVPVGAYSIVATKTGYAPFTLANVGVAGGATTNVSLVLAVAAGAPGTVSGVVTDSKADAIKGIAATPIAGAKVSVQGQTATATTDATGAFTLTAVAPGPLFLSVTPPDLTTLLPSENRSAVMLAPGATVAGVKLALSARPSDAATYVGMTAGSCVLCHGAGNTNTGNKADAVKSAAHNRSLARIARDAGGVAQAAAFTRLLNPTLTNARTVMLPLAGSIAVSGSVVTGTGTLFSTGGVGVALQPGDTIGYTPKGLGWTVLGTIKSVDSDTQVTLTANAAYAPGVTSLAAGTKYSVTRLSSTGHTHLWPEDANDIVAPAWPGVKATNPNYDPNDPLIYAATGAYADGQVNVYLCNLKGSTVQGVTYTNDEYVQKFGGNPYTCGDGTFWDGTTTPLVPMVHIDVVYGGQGDKDGSMVSHPNVGVFKQRFQGRLADIKAAASWTYTTPPAGMLGGKAYDSLTLPIQILESGDKVNGGFKMNGYHPTEQKFPGESWTQRDRTFSHACAGCHNTGLQIAWDMAAVNLPIKRDDGSTSITEANIKTYNFMDENLTCEHCHGPGSEHVAAGGGRGKAIINPKYLTAEAERQVCGKCHTYDDATNAKPAQGYGFEYPWNSDNAAKIGGGDFVPGVYEVKDFLNNLTDAVNDGEALWDPAKTGGKLYGQAHRQQNLMLSYSKHANNPYEKVTCTNCHDPHSTYRASSTVVSPKGDTYAYAGVAYKDNTLCLTCHAGNGIWSAVSKDDVAALHQSSNGVASKNGVAIATLTPEAIETSTVNIAAAISQHMADKAKMSNALYQPNNDGLPTGRCTSCHMPKVAKSGGYTMGTDDQGNEAIVEGDQASHVFDIIWPYQSRAMSMGGPTFQSGYYGQGYTASNTVKYDKFGYMPNSCSKCHAGSRPASVFCPDTTTVYPTYWPLIDAPNASYPSTSCFTSKNAP